MMNKVTVVFLIKDDEVLLAMKKRGFGEGWWNGTGGKPDETDKSIEDTAIRETLEEIGCTPKKLKKVAIIDFYFDDNEPWNQQMHGYLCDDWDGEPRETEEMTPHWFKINELPLDKMWPADKFWIPMILSGKKIKGEVHFNQDKELISHNFEEASNVI